MDLIEFEHEFLKLGRDYKTKDVDKFNRRISRLDKSNDFVKFSIRIVNSENEPIPCLVKLYAIKGFGGKITKILGVIETINKDEKEVVKEQDKTK